MPNSEKADAVDEHSSIKSSKTTKSISSRLFKKLDILHHVPKPFAFNSKSNSKSNSNLKDSASLNSTLETPERADLSSRESKLKQNAKSKSKELKLKAQQLEMTTANIVIVYYSMYGHIRGLANELVKGIEKVGNVSVTLLQVPETLPQEVLTMMHAPPKDQTVKIATPADLVAADGVLFGIPTRFGMAAAQMKAFMDTTGQVWMSKGLVGKPAGVFFSTNGLGGGQETTALTWLTQLTHHGMMYVPMGYVLPDLARTDVVRGGSPYGPGVIASMDGSRKIHEIEVKAAQEYGERFAKVCLALKKGRAAM